VENKDKTLDDILVDKWKKKCPGGASTKNKRKRCVSDALAESDDDTPEEKQVKDALKSLLEEDSDGTYEFLSTSSSRTFGDIEKEEVSQDISTSENSNSSRNPLRKFKLPKKRSKVTSTSGNSGSSGNPLRKIKLPKKKVKPTPSPDSPTDEETDSSRRRIKTSAKKYLQKVKDKLKVAAVWYLENKDKTIDQILVDKWKEKCPGGASTKNKRKRCVSDALAESDDDTPEEKDMKDALKSLLEENSDEVYEFLSTSSSRTFGDIEKEEEIQDKLSEMPEKYEKLWEEDKSKTFSELESEFEREKTEKISKLSNDMKAIFSNLGRQISIKLQSWSSSCSKENRAIQSRRCQTTAGRDGEKKQKCRKAQATKRQSCIEEVFEVQEEDSIQDQNIKAELEELATQDLETGTQLVESCQIPENIRSKRSPGSGAKGKGKGTAPAWLPKGKGPAAGSTTPATSCLVKGGPVGSTDIVPPSQANYWKHFVDPTLIDNTETDPAAVNILGAERWEAGTKYKRYRTREDEKRIFKEINTVLKKGTEFDLKKFSNYGATIKSQQDGKGFYDYQRHLSDNNFEYEQIEWKNHTNNDGTIKEVKYGSEDYVEGHFEKTKKEGRIIIGVATYQKSGDREVNHLEPAPAKYPAKEISTVVGPTYVYNTDSKGQKGGGRGF